MKKNLALLPSIMLLLLMSTLPAAATSNLPGDDPFEGIENAIEIENNHIEGVFDSDNFDVQNHWYSYPMVEPAGFECKLTTADGEVSYVEFYDGDDFICSMDYCGTGDGVRFEVENRLYICIRGSMGSYSMEVNEWEMHSGVTEMILENSYASDPEYLEFFGYNGPDMGDDFYIGPGYGAYVTVDFSYPDPAAESFVSILVTPFSGSESGDRRVNILTEARFVIDRIPDALFLMRAYGDDGGEYLIRCWTQASY